MSNTDQSFPYRLDADLISLRSLVAIADEGSFSAAARRVGRTQSAVSLQIAKLEERVGVKLLDRTSRTVTQTQAGEVMTAYARRILALADEAMLAITAPDSADPLRIGFAEYLAPTYLHELLARFRRAHAGVELQLKLGSGTGLKDQFERGELDVVVSGPEREGGTVLLEEPLVWACPAEFELDLTRTLPLMLMPPPCSYRKAAYDALLGADRSWTLTMEANTIAGIQSGVAAGLGISALPASTLTPAMREARDGLPELPLTRMMAYQPAHDPHPLAARFIDYVKDAVQHNS